MCWQELLSHQPRLPAYPSLDQWYGALLERLQQPSPLALAILGGRAAATPGLAFLAGYQAALRALWPSAPWTLGALCVTENKSLRPADMQTRLSWLHVNGRKDFVTAGDAADWLLVVAREEGPDEDAPRVALVVVQTSGPGVRLEQLPALPFMPDVSHARVQLESAPCERLAGDGWSDYAKPFRTIEDLHVLSAMSAWLYGVGQTCDWPQPLQLRLLALLAGCSEVSRLCASSAATHVLLAGLFAQFEALQVEIDAALAAGPAEWATLWSRDKTVMNVANSARAQRLQKALASL